MDPGTRRAGSRRHPPVTSRGAYPRGVTIVPTPPDDATRRNAERMAAETGLPIELLLAPVTFTPNPVTDPHAVTRKSYPSGVVAWTCACGRWEAVATGPCSTRWAAADHARHRHDEETGG